MEDNVNYDKLIQIASWVAMIGLFISAIGVFAFRHYTGKKSEQSNKKAAKERLALNNKLDTEFENTVKEIKEKKRLINEKIEAEATAIIDELSLKSKSAIKAIEVLREESSSASNEIAQEVKKIKESTEITIPLKIVAYEDIQKYINGFVFTFKKMFDDSVPIKSPNNLKDFLTEEYLSKSWDYLDIDSNPNVKGLPKYSNYLSNALTFITSKGDIILSRHSKVVDDEIIKIIYELNNCSEVNTLKNIHRLRYQNVINQPPILKAFSIRMTENQIKNIRKIVEWCEKKNLEYREYDVDSELIDKYKTNPLNENPPNMAEKGILNNKLIPELEKGK